MNGVRFPPGYRLERLHREHPRRNFQCGEEAVEDWLITKALQQQEKHLSTTKVLLDIQTNIAGYYTLATGQVDFGDLPEEIKRGLPRRLLPVAKLAWFAVSKDRQGQGLGTYLLGQALRDCHEAGKIFAFVAVLLDCINDAAKAFYQKREFKEVPGRPYRLYLSAKQIDAMMERP
ncbi:MAG: GNAT family N-acetyltransferase [Pirellulales bacterium]